MNVRVGVKKNKNKNCESQQAHWKQKWGSITELSFNKKRNQIIFQYFVLYQELDVGPIELLYCSALPFIENKFLLFHFNILCNKNKLSENAIDQYSKI